MERAYIIEKQVVREFWYFVVCHAAMMINQVPGRLGLKLTTPFELVHNSKPDSNTWFELFPIGYCNCHIDKSERRSKIKAHALYGIAVGRYDNFNSIIFYNPITSSYYHAPDFHLDELRLPITNLQNYFCFDCGLTCDLLQKKMDPIHEPLPPGTRVSIQHQDSLV